jgi:hypothetical protein
VIPAPPKGGVVWIHSVCDSHVPIAIVQIVTTVMHVIFVFAGDVAHADCEIVIRTAQQESCTNTGLVPPTLVTGKCWEPLKTSPPDATPANATITA